MTADPGAVDEQLAVAVVTAVLAARPVDDDSPSHAQRPAERWAARESGLRQPLATGPDAWRWSLR